MDEIFDLIESVSEGFPTYSCINKMVKKLSQLPKNRRKKFYYMRFFFILYYFIIFCRRTFEDFTYFGYLETVLNTTGEYVADEKQYRMRMHMHKRKHTKDFA